MRRIKVLFVVLTLLVILASTLAFVGCKSKGSTVVNTEPFKGVKVFIYNGIIEGQELPQNASVKTLEFTYDEVKDVDEGLISLLDLKQEEYNQKTTNLYNRISDVVLTDEEATQGIRIVKFTSKESDQDTTDAARIISYQWHRMIQTSKNPEDLTFEEGTYIFIAKVQL